MSSKDFRFGISSDVRGIDLNQLLVKHPISTFFMRIASDMPELDLRADDVVLVDRSLKPKPNDLVVISQADDSELKLARFQDLTGGMQLWGVAEHLIRKVKT